MRESIKKTIMHSMDLTEAEADKLIRQAKEAFNQYLADSDEDSAENICEEFFGLEPDYLDEFF